MVGLVSTAGAQMSGSEKYAESITADDLRAHPSVLASDSLGGRGTGQIGQELAALYLANQFVSKLDFQIQYYLLVFLAYTQNLVC